MSPASSIRHSPTVMRYVIALTVALLRVSSSVASEDSLTPVSEKNPSSILVTGLKTEHVGEPLGVDTAQPRFRWLLESTGRGKLQSAYQILVASTLKNLLSDAGDKWDSGKVHSDNSVEVVYAGRSLASGERAYWKVRVWDEADRESAYSAPSLFEMGLLSPSDWKGRWIAASKEISAPLLRREFNISSAIRRARAYVAGLGYYELSINGRRVGDRMLDPAPTTFSSRVLYATYDVTNFLQSGDNAVGIMLGRGWYSPEPNGQTLDPRVGVRRPYGDRPRLLLQMNIELADGRHISMESDEDWKTSASPITYNDIAQGEHYDARLEQPGWSTPGFDASTWTRASIIDAPGGRLVAQSLPPARIMQTLPVVKHITPTSPAFDDTQIFDFGQNFSGWACLEVKGPRGTRLEIQYGARLHPEDRTLDVRSNNFPGVSAGQTDTYILKGNGTEMWEPRFTLHGFRYVQIAGLSDQVVIQKLEGCVVHSAVEFSGTFHSSNDLLNQIHSNVHWTLRSSLQGIPQDAADRDERVAWLGDPAFVIEDYLNNFDMAGFWEKWLADIQDTQGPGGAVPVVSPNPWQWQGSALWPSWQSTYPILVWHLYQHYGDRRVLETHYANIKKLADYETAAAKGDLITDEFIGDHMEPQPEGFTSFESKHTPAALTANVHYFATVLTVARSAEVLGKHAEAKRYFTRADRIKTAFNRRFFDPQEQTYATGSQTSQALPLEWELVPPNRIAGAMENLLTDIRRHDMHVSTGIIGTNSLVQVLPRHGATEVLYALANETSFPSLGHQVKMGATTLCETYECSPWNSQNMKMFASWDKFLYGDLAGIQLASTGYSRVRIEPQPVGDLNTVKATQKTVRGEIDVEWEKAPGSFDLEVSIPAGVQADIVIPKLGLKTPKITEGEMSVWEANSYMPGRASLNGAHADANSIVFHTGSGAYHFRLTGTRN